MSDEVAAAVKAIVGQQLQSSLIWLAIISIVASAFGAFFGAFFKRAADLAAQQLFAQNLISQAREQANAIEQVKTEFQKQILQFGEDLKMQAALTQELKRQGITQENLIHQKFVETLSELARLVGAGSQAICWTSWIAQFHPDILNEEHMKDYEKNISEILGKLVGARVALAALNPGAHSELSEAIEKLYKLDVAAGNAYAKFRASRSEGTTEWAALHEISRKFDKEFLDKVIQLSTSLSPTKSPVSSGLLEQAGMKAAKMH
jgi:hypothetical protein